MRHPDQLPPAPPAHPQPTGAATPPWQGQVEELLASVAHELRRPLTALLGALATIQQQPHLPAATRHELLTMARRQGTQLHQLLDRLLAVAALDHPETSQIPSRLVDVAALATEAAEAAQLAHPDQHITIEVAGPLPVHADPLAITRILGNLLDNAATHTPAGTPIRLFGGRDGVQAILAVHDQGPGIPTDAAERIFQRYGRAAQPTGRSGGLGLGLYIARRLALANSGDLRLSGPPGGRGACFELRLLMARPTPDPNSRPAPPSARRREP